MAAQDRALLTYAERWVRDIPWRWARNGAIFGLISRFGGVGGLQEWAKTLGDLELFSSVFLLLFPAACFGVLGLILGLFARLSLRGSTRDPVDALLRKITRHWIGGAILLAALMVLADLVFQWRVNRKAFSQAFSDSFAFNIGIVAMVVVFGYLTALVSRRGLRQAREIDTAIANAASRNR